MKKNDNKLFGAHPSHKGLRLGEVSRINFATKHATTAEQLEDVVESARKQLEQEKRARGIEQKAPQTEEDTDVEA